MGAKRLDVGPNAFELYENADKFLANNYQEIKDLTGIEPANSVSESALSMQALRNVARLPVTPKNDTLVLPARDLVSALRRSKSDYAEAKVFGPVGLHSDNFAGIMADPYMKPEDIFRLESAAMKRGIPFDTWPKAPVPPASAFSPGAFADRRAAEAAWEKSRFQMAKQMQELRK
jgi:hypothetical protein